MKKTMTPYLLWPVLAISLLALPLVAQAENSMRRCMLLPMRDSVGGAIGFEVFKKVERYLKQSDWCYYETNSPILDILGNYRENLDQHLENKKVLKVIADKTQAGSLIRVKVESRVKGVGVETKVIGGNGDDLYFKESTQLDNDDPEVIAQTVKNWLEVYETTIPYDGRVTGVLGDQFTIDVGESYGVLPGQGVRVVRPSMKRRHPLLKEIVDWETEKIADAKIFNLGANQANAKVQEYESKKKVQMKDWVILEEEDKSEQEIQAKYRKDSDYEFGKLGKIGIGFLIGDGSNTVVSGNTKKISGVSFGIDFRGELWATRNYWGGLEVGRGFGSYSEEEGSVQLESNSLSQSVFKLMAGYKYLPLGFFYGPQIDGYVGYANYGYGFETSRADNITDVSFSGILVGVKGSVPVQKLIRLKLRLDFIFNPGYDEEVELMGEDTSTSNYHLEFGGEYQYSPSMSFDGTIGHTSNKAEFGGASSVSIKQTKLRAGVTFNY